MASVLGTLLWAVLLLIVGYAIGVVCTTRQLADDDDSGDENDND